jgi:SAM-dependent methyltransferase|tara:strand:- start:767 stop:1708 length:942 start_codon:yes stop_codon:yes gene_type:complete
MGEIWNITTKIFSVSELIDKCIGMEPFHLAEFTGHFGRPSEVFGKNEKELRRKIAKDPSDWESKFLFYTRKFVAVLVQDCIYYLTYDQFSENSRDNTEKTEILDRYFDKSSKLLEIGPGTGPLLRRLLQRKLDVIAIEINPHMIEECKKLYPPAKGKIIQGDFLEKQFKERFDGIFVESGFFLFTKIRPRVFMFEMFHDNPNTAKEYAEKGLKRVYSLLRPKGTFLIGIQEITGKVGLGEGVQFSMERNQHQDYALRTIEYSAKKHFLGKASILWTIPHKKSTMSKNEFEKLAQSVGFKGISILRDQWISLTK